jgi:hypothetical protein
MANRFLGEVSVDAGGKSYKLRMDFNAMCEFEDATGKDALEVLAGMEGGKASVKHLRALAWAALRKHHPDTTLEDAGEIISENTDLVKTLLEATMPAKGEGKDAGKPRSVPKPK